MGKEGASRAGAGSVGVKYPRDELIASVLTPRPRSPRAMSPTLALADGRVVTGIVRNETADTIEIQDADAKLVKVAKDDIDDRKRSDVSLMPNGLARARAHRTSPT